MIERSLLFMLRRSGPYLILILMVWWLYSLGALTQGWAQESAPGSAVGEEVRIVQIEVVGNKRIESEVILAKVKTRAGDLFRPEVLREDLKAIYRLGYFQDVHTETETRPDGMKIIFVVVERPTLVEIVFAGNKEILADKLQQQIALRTQTFVDDAEIKNNAEQIRRYYEQEGYHQTEVIPVLKTVAEDQRSLTFYIKEGLQARIRDLGFPGRKAISRKKVIKAIETREYFPLTSWLTSSGYYKKDVLSLDVERIRELYLNNGYLQVQVGSPEVELQEDRTQVRVPIPVAHGELDYPYEFREISATIRIPVVEGDTYRIRKIEVTGHTIFKTSELLSALKLTEGDLFRKDRLRKGVADIHDLYGEKGYLYAAIVPEFKTHPEDRTVDVLLDVKEDRPIHVRQIQITGNDKTRDKVVRREIRLDEQDTMNTKLLRRSFQRINNLNFFDSIEITPQRVGDDQVDLLVRVQEKSTGALSIGGGYSSVDGAVGLAEISQGNLFGRGQLLRGRGEFGGRRTTYSLTFREPYLLDKPVSGTINLFNTVRDFNTYNERRVGGDLIFGKSFTEYLNGSVSYTRESLDIFDVTDSAPNRIREQGEEGKSVTSSVGVTLARDTRDFFFDPREGGRTAVLVDYAGTFLGGNNDFVKTVLDASRFFPLKWDVVFSLHGRAGYAGGIQGDELPLGERFFVGGINTVRGFEFGTAGPCKDDEDKTVRCDQGEIVGGNKELIFNAELIIPLVTEARVKGVFFFDAGRAFDNDESIRFSELRYGAGFGIRWISPIGPLRLELGYNLDREEGEEPNQLEFNIGTLF
jgi:outer membrane protein insertion porin family